MKKIYKKAERAECAERKKMGKCLFGNGVKGKWGKWSKWSKYELHEL